MDKLHILFVDDDMKVLNGLRRMLYKMASCWQMDFVSSGEAALQKMQQTTYHVLVTDMRMPGIDGIQLLIQVQANYPATIRIVLSGQSDHQKFVEAAGLAHQFLAKPCDAGTLRQVISRSDALRSLLTNPVLQRLVADMKGLPVAPAILGELMASLATPAKSLKEIGNLVACDMGLTAKVLQLVNSPFFGLRRQIQDPKQAVILLGAETIHALVLAVSTFDVFAAEWPAAHMASLYSHAFRVGKLARHIATDLGSPDIQAWALVAGMLHDVGKLVLVAQTPHEVCQIEALAASRNLSRDEAETEVLSASHAEVGAYLLGLWGFNEQLVRAVATHHQPPPDLTFPLDLAAVLFLANALDHVWHPAAPHAATVTLPFLESPILAGRVEQWQASFSREMKELL